MTKLRKIKIPDSAFEHKGEDDGITSVSTTLSKIFAAVDYELPSEIKDRMIEIGDTCIYIHLNIAPKFKMKLQPTKDKRPVQNVKIIMHLSEDLEESAWVSKKSLIVQPEQEETTKKK